MANEIERLNVEIEELRQELNDLITQKGDVLDPEVVLVNERLDAKLRDYYRLLRPSKAQYAARQESMPDDIGMLDRVRNTEFGLYQSTATWLEELIKSRNELPPSLIALHEKAAEWLCGAIRAKHDLSRW